MKDILRNNLGSKHSLVMKFIYFQLIANKFYFNLQLG